MSRVEFMNQLKNLLWDIPEGEREEALNYSNFKKEIINKGITDRKEYKAIKSKYVTDMLARAKEWYSKL